MRQKTLNLIYQVKIILNNYNVRITVRQLYYQLVARQIILIRINGWIVFYLTQGKMAI